MYFMNLTILHAIACYIILLASPIYFNNLLKLQKCIYFIGYIISKLKKKKNILYYYYYYLLQSKSIETSVYRNDAF